MNPAMSAATTTSRTTKEIVRFRFHFEADIATSYTEVVGVWIWMRGLCVSESAHPSIQ